MIPNTCCVLGLQVFHRFTVKVIKLQRIPHVLCLCMGFLKGALLQKQGLLKVIKWLLAFTVALTCRDLHVQIYAHIHWHPDFSVWENFNEETREAQNSSSTIKHTDQEVALLCHRNRACVSSLLFT